MTKSENLRNESEFSEIGQKKSHNSEKKKIKVLRYKAKILR